MWRGVTVDPIIAGAVFTDAQINLIIAIMIGIAVLGVLALAVFVRSIVRLATKPEKSRVDIVIVIVGLLLLVPPIVGGVAERLRSHRIESTLRDEAQAVIEPTTRLPETAFEDGRRWQIGGDNCDTWLIPVDLVGAGFALEDPAIDAVVRSEAQAFEDAGWAVTRYAPRNDLGTLGFRASRDDYFDVGLRQETSGSGLAYVFTDSACDGDPFKLELWRDEVGNF